MLEEFRSQLNQQQQTLVELEDELEMEISRVIALKNKIDPELIEDIERIEEGLYVEVKMINETKKNVDVIIKTFKTNDNKEKNLVLLDSKEMEKKEADIQKFKKRSEKLAKQLIEATEEIEELTKDSDTKIKERENELKNELITRLQEKDNLINNQLIESKNREAELLKEIEKLKKGGSKDSDDVIRVKNFFDKKIKNLKSTMSQEFKQREKEIAEKAIVVYNKKKERIYYDVVKTVLNMKNRSPKIDKLVKVLRESLALAEDVFSLENLLICKKCKEVVHISQSKCPNCNSKLH